MHSCVETVCHAGPHCPCRSRRRPPGNWTALMAQLGIYRRAGQNRPWPVHSGIRPSASVTVWFYSLGPFQSPDTPQLGPGLVAVCQQRLTPPYSTYHLPYSNLHQSIPYPVPYGRATLHVRSFATYHQGQPLAHCPPPPKPTYTAALSLHTLAGVHPPAIGPSPDLPNLVSHRDSPILDEHARSRVIFTISRMVSMMTRFHVRTKLCAV